MENDAVKATIHKIVDWLAGEPNKRILDWVNADDEAYARIIEFMDRCATNGWKQLEESPFQFADQTSVEIAQELYDRAIKHFGGEK